MELVEMMIEGVRGYRTMARIPLGAGVTELGPCDGREAAIIPVLLELLYPKATGEAVLPDLVDPAAPASRAGVVIVGRDGTTYRILRDLKSGKVSMLRQTPGGMEPVSSEASAITQLVTAQIGFPQEDLLREVFFTKKSDLPSQQADALETSGLNQVSSSSSRGEARGAARGEESGKNRAWKRSLPPGFAAAEQAASAVSAMSADERAARLSTLKAQLSQFESVKALEFELDGVQKSGFALDEKLRPLDHLRRQLKENEETAARFAEFAEVPPDLPQQASRIAQQKADLDARLKDLDERSASYDMQLARELKAARGPRDLVRAASRDQVVVGGLVVGVLSIVIAVVGTPAVDALRYVALLDIPAFGAFVWGAFRFIGEAENTLRIKRQIELLQKDKEKLLNAFALEANNLKALLRRFDLDQRDMDEVASGIAQYRSALHAVEAARAALDEALGGEDLAAIEAERARISARAKALEDDLYKQGGYLGNREELEAELRALEDAAAGRAPMSAPVVEEVSSPSLVAPPAGMLPTAIALARLVRHAADLMLTDLDTCLTALAPRAAQYLGGLSDRRFAQVIFGPKGEVSVVDAATGRALPFGMLTPGDRDIVYLSVKCTVIEAAVKRQRIPVVFERAFETVPDVKDPLLVRMLQYLGGATQILLMSKKHALAAVGGTRVALP